MKSTGTEEQHQFFDTHAHMHVLETCSRSHASASCLLHPHPLTHQALISEDWRGHARRASVKRSLKLNSPRAVRRIPAAQKILGRRKNSTMQPTNTRHFPRVVKAQDAERRSKSEEKIKKAVNGLTRGFPCMSLFGLLAGGERRWKSCHFGEPGQSGNFTIKRRNVSPLVLR